MLVDVSEECQRPRGEPIGRRDVGIGRVAHSRQQRSSFLAYVGNVESFLGAEVVVEHGLGDAGLLSDLVHRDGVEATPGKRRARDREHLALALEPRHARPQSATGLRAGRCGSEVSHWLLQGNLPWSNTILHTRGLNMTYAFVDQMMEQNKTGELRSPVSQTFDMHLVEFSRGEAAYEM